VYVAYDDIPGFGARVATAQSADPPTFSRDTLAGTLTCCINPGLRLAVNQNNGYIYSIFQQSVTTDPNADPKNINYMLNRSTDGGVTWRVNGNPGGMVVANADSTQPAPKFGTVNALLGGVDHAAVDPVSGDVYYVYGRRDAGTSNNRLAIRRLTANGAGGLNIGPEVFVTGQVEAA